MKNEVVSVIAPAYNHEKYVYQALKSVANQTYENKELIVIDDKSSDRTLEIIANYIEQSRVKKAFPAGIQFISHEKNMNAPYTLNEGIRKAKGEYITIINTDDMYEDTRIQKMIEVLKKESKEIAFTHVLTINEFNEIKKHNDFEEMFKKLQKYPKVNMVLPIKNAAVSTGNFLFRKSLYEQVGCFRSEYHFIHDWDFILKACLYSEPVYINDTNYIYRFHETNTIKQMDQSVEMMKKKEQEVYNVLYSFVDALRTRKYYNKDILPEKCWEYFFQQKEQCYAGQIWKDWEMNKNNRDKKCQEV